MAVIYYGTEKKEYMLTNLDKWTQITGVPDLFVVKDQNLSKFRSQYLERFYVVSLDEALRRYPDADIWLVYSWESTAREAGNNLLKKVAPDKIHFLEADLEYRKGCGRLGRSLHYKVGKVPMCTVGNRKHPSFRATASVSEMISGWREYSEKLIRENQLDSPNECLGCPLLKYGFFKRTVTLRNLRFLQGLAHDSCNLRCKYCSASQSGRWAKLKDDTGPTTYDIVRQFSEIPEFIEMGAGFTITFANGELCVNKYFDEIADILARVTWKVELLSNMSVYREGLATLMQDGRIAKIITSIDAGTRETFKNLKQNDRFDEVVKNLQTYPIDKTDLYVKYVFVEGYNDNETDIDGFYEIAKSTGGTIMISADNKTNDIPFTASDNMRELTLRLIHKAKADGIRLKPDDNNINAIDADFIKSHFGT